jgi:hypothetical protein
MKECEYIIIELEKYIDFYGILDVCAKRRMQTEIYKVIMGSPDIPEAVKNNFVVYGF